MPVCGVAGCTGESGHRLPIPEEMRSKWLQAIRWTGADPPECTMVCYKHFRRSDYKEMKQTDNVSNTGSLWRLRRKSVPSIFDWTVRVQFHEGTPVLLNIGQRELSPVRNVDYTVGDISISYDSSDDDDPSQPITTTPPSPKEDKASLVARTFRAVLAISKSDKETSLVLPTLDGSLVISNAKPLAKPLDCDSNSIINGFVEIRIVADDGRKTNLQRFPVYVQDAENPVVAKEYVPLMDTSGFNLTNVIVFDATDEGVESLKGQLLELNIQNPEEENESDPQTASISVCELPQDDSPDEDEEDFFGFSTKDLAISKKLEMIKKANLDLRSRTARCASPYSVINCTSSSLVRPPGPVGLAKEMLASKAVCSKLMNAQIGNLIDKFKRQYPNFPMKSNSMKVGAPQRTHYVNGHLKNKTLLGAFRPDLRETEGFKGVHADYPATCSSKRRDGTLLSVKECESPERHLRNNFKKLMAPEKIVGQPVVADLSAQHDSRTIVSKNVSDCVSLPDPSSTDADEIEKVRLPNEETSVQGLKGAEHSVSGATLEEGRSSPSLKCITTVKAQEPTVVLASKGNNFLSGRTTEDGVAKINQVRSVDSYALKDAPRQVEKGNLVSDNIRFLGRDGGMAFYIQLDDDDAGGDVMTSAAEHQGITAGSTSNAEESETNGSSVTVQQAILQNRTESLDSGRGSPNVMDLENDRVSVDGEQNESTSVDNNGLAFEVFENDSEISLCEKGVEALKSVPAECWVDYDIPVQVLDQTKVVTQIVNDENVLCTDENTNLNIQVPNTCENNILEMPRSLMSPSLLEHNYSLKRRSEEIPDQYIPPKKIKGPQRKPNGYLNFNQWAILLERLHPEIVDKYAPPTDGDPTSEAGFSDDLSNDDCSVVEQDPLSTDHAICYHCNVTLPSDAMLERHIVQEHADNSSACIHCFTIFDSVIAWNTHMEEEHPVKESRITYLCPQCDFVTKDNSALRSHIDTEHKVQCNFTCPRCPFKCISNEILQIHLEKSHSKQNLAMVPYGYVPTRLAIETNESAKSVPNVIHPHPRRYGCAPRMRLPVHTNRASIVQRSTILQGSETVNRAQTVVKGIRRLLPVQARSPATSTPSNIQRLAIQDVSTPCLEVVPYTKQDHAPRRKPITLGPMLPIGASHPHVTERLITSEMPQIHPETSNVHSNQIGTITNNYFPQSPPEPSVSMELDVEPMNMNATSGTPQLTLPINPTSTQHQCPECTTVLSCYEELGRHLIKCHSSKEGHKKQPRIQCSECSGVFNSHIRLRRHMNREHQNITCPICANAFPRNYISHHMKYHNTDYFVCKFCNFATTVDAVMQLHKMVIHKKKPQGSISCPICPPHLTTFAKLSQLETHSRQRHFAVLIR